MPGNGGVVDGLSRLLLRCKHYKLRRTGTTHTQRRVSAGAVGSVDGRARGSVGRVQTQVREFAGAARRRRWAQWAVGVTHPGTGASAKVAGGPRPAASSTNPLSG